MEKTKQQFARIEVYKVVKEIKEPLDVIGWECKNEVFRIFVAEPRRIFVR
ncbi:MAG: hypothetical protein ACTSRS_23040 [Candidatus Helarchaeota archaeon]